MLEDWCPTVRGLVPVLPQPAPPAGGAVGSDRHPSKMAICQQAQLPLASLPPSTLVHELYSAGENTREVDNAVGASSGSESTVHGLGDVAARRRSRIPPSGIARTSPARCSSANLTTTSTRHGPPFAVCATCSLSCERRRSGGRRLRRWRRSRTRWPSPHGRRKSPTVRSR